MRNEDAEGEGSGAGGKKRQEEAENEAGSIERPEHNSEKRWTSECVRLQWYYKPSKLIIRSIVEWFCRGFKTWERKWMVLARLLWKLLLLRTSNNYLAISVLQSVTFHFRARNFMLYKRVYIESIVVILQFETLFLGSLIFSYRTKYRFAQGFIYCQFMRQLFLSPPSFQFCPDSVINGKNFVFILRFGGSP